MESYPGDEDKLEEIDVDRPQEAEDKTTFDAGAVVVNIETGERTPMTDSEAADLLKILVG